MGAQAVRLSNVDIDNALKNKDFEVLFQPIFDLGNGALARVETFIRWRHPSLGVLPPGAFISFFETQGRMSELTRYVLAEALATYKAWRGPFPPGFSINLALSDLSDDSFASHLIVLLRDSGFPIELVTLECPMPPVDADLEATARQLQRLSETGARLAIEVRGRANDFLKTVRPFPFAEIKTGGAAILRFARTVRGPGLSAISELLELANEQKAAITAVGVEDQASLAALRGLGFAAAQGNHLAKVGPLAQFMPSHVNDVRTLLGLEPLSSEDLAALFRTGAPQFAAAAPAAAEADLAPAAEAARPDVETVARRAAIPSVESEDALVERLAARIARVDGASPRHMSEPSAEARAAAIARARRKSLARERLASRNALKSKGEARE
ncbi:MAG: EAL domain-containing protein [Parvularculaceae bacterium]|nr:EAL domain-containing protein [Parvularculaceae bacterium]